ncbi:MAG: AI-2E family transporter [Eubacteriales bacterium]|nr:AI-2E family transporter [Eubacteriales bacterium]
MKLKKKELSIVCYLVLAAVLVLAVRYFDTLVSGLLRLWGIALPLLTGCVEAYILNIIMRRLERGYFPGSGKAWVKRTRRPVCAALSIFVIAAIAFLILRLVVPELAAAVVVIGQRVPVLFEQTVDWLSQNADAFPETVNRLQSLEIDWNALGDTVWNYLKSGLGGVVNSTVTIVSGVVSGVINFVISLIFAVYLLMSKEKLASQGRRIVHAYGKPVWIARCRRILVTADRTFSSFIVGQVTEAVILGSLCTLGMMLFRFPYAPMIGAFVGATALIPVVGAYLGAVVGVVMIGTQDPLKALLFVVFIMVLQQLEGNLIYPRVVGSSIGLPGMWVLAAVTLGGGLMGIPGMLLGVPLAATLYKLLAYDVNKRTAV